MNRRETEGWPTQSGGERRKGDDAEIGVPYGIRCVFPQENQGGETMGKFKYNFRRKETNHKFSSKFPPPSPRLFPSARDGQI